MVAFGFLPQNVGMWQRPTNDFLLKNECSLSGGDNHRWRGHSNACL